MTFIFGLAGRNDHRNGDGRTGHPSGVPRPYGGRGRGRGSYNSSRGNTSSNERQDSGYDAPKWDSATKDGEDGWGNFSGAKNQSTPVREALPGGWGTGGSDRGGSSWGGNGGNKWGDGATGSGSGGGWGNASGGAEGNWSGTGANDAGPDNGSSGWGNAPKRSSSQSQAGNGWSGNNAGSGGGGW